MVGSRTERRSSLTAVALHFNRGRYEGLPCVCGHVCTQAVEDGTLEETEAKKQRKRKKKATGTDADSTSSSKVTASTHSYVHVHVCLYVSLYSFYVYIIP